MMLDEQYMWDTVARLSIGGRKASEIGRVLNITPNAVNRIRLRMRNAGQLPVMKRGYRPKTRPRVTAETYANYVAEVLADLHDTALSEMSERAAATLIRSTIAEIDRQTWHHIGGADAMEP